MTSRDMDTIPMYTAILVFVTVVLMASRQVVSEEDQRLTTDQACVNIYPSDDQCEAWARFGECEMNREWMEQNCRYSCHFCDVDQSQNRTLATQKPAASSNLAPSDSALTDPENIHLQNITLNSTVDVFTSNEWEEPELGLDSTSSSNSSATKRTSLWQVSNQTTTNPLSIFYNHLSASTDRMDDAYQPEDVTEEPHFEMDNNEAPESSELVSEVQGNDMLTSSPNRMKTSEPSSGQRTSAAPDKEETSIIAAVWNTSVSVDFIEVTTAPSRQVTSAYEQSGVMELTVQPDETTSVGDKAKNKSSENEAEYPSSLKPTVEVDDSSILDRKTTTRIEMEITPSRKMSSEITMIMTTMDKIADEEMTERIQPASNDTAPHTTRQITDEMSTTASNDTSIQSSTERSTAADTKTSTTVTSSALGFTEREMTDGVVTNMTTRSTTTTEAQCVNRWDLDTGSLDCEGWAAIGECEKNSIWMWQYCQKACQKCRSTDDDDASDCFNLYGNNSDCDTWAYYGECENNPFWMLVYCKLSCNVCSSLPPGENNVHKLTTLLPPGNEGNTTLIGQCDDGQFRCLDTRECIEGAKICDGAKDCGDGSDEDDSICKVTFTCLESQYQCVDGLCIGRQLLCDGQIDCTSSEDEDSTLCQSITTMTGLKTSLISTNEITLSWTATYNSHELITGYEVSYHPVDDPTNTVTFTYDTYVTLVTFYDLKPDTQYVFTVKPIVLYFDTQGTTITARTSAVVCVNVYTEDPTMCDIWASSGECEKNPWWMSRYCARSCKVCVAESTAGQTMPSPTLESTAGTTAGELSLDTTSTSWETAVAEARSSLLAAVLTTAASSRVLYNDTTAVQSTSGSSEKADVSFKASFTTTVPPAAKSVTTAESMEEQVTFLYSTAAPPPTAAPITAVSESAASSTAVNMSGPVTTESGSFHPTTAAYTAGSRAVKPTTAVGEDISDNEHTESKRDVGSTKEPAQPVDALLIYAEALDGSIVVLDLRQPGSKKMIGQSQKPVAIGYDPVTQTVFWSDVLEHRIYKKSLIEDGDTEVLLNVEDGLGITEGMAIDSYNQRLYFSHYYTQVVDGITLKWHSIDVLDLVNGSRHTVVSDLDSPRGLWVDSWNGYLFYTDVGAGKVVRCNLDGSDRFVIRSGLISPNAVVYDGHVVYVIDSNYGGAEHGGLYKTDINGQNWQKVTSGIDDLKVPFAMTLGNNKLYITEWESHSIITYDTISKRSSVFSDAYLPMGITYSILKQDKTDDVRCEESGCGGMCLHGANQEAVCYCPSYGVDVLQTDGTSCSKPKSYMLVADANTIKMLSFASNELIVHTAIQGDLLTLYSALIVTENGTVYYTDTNRQIIYMTTLQDGATVQELFKAYNYIDGLAYNPTTSMLYWTAYGDGSIMKLNINSLAYSITHSGLEKPRDIVIDVVNGYMYWTELGVAPKVMRSYIDGSKKEAILASPLSNPNGLYLDQVTETLYILDSAKMMNKTIVYVCENMNASEVSCQELMSIKTADLLYGIYVYGNILYFSDWSTPSVHYYDRTSEMFGIVSSQFIRPTQLAVYGDVPDHCIDAPCSEICVSLLHTFTCHCSEDRGPLLDDGWTCKKDAMVRVTVAMTTTSTQLEGADITTHQPLVTGEVQNTTKSVLISTSQGITASHGMINPNLTTSAVQPKASENLETTEMIQFINSTSTSKIQNTVTMSTNASAVTEYPTVYKNTTAPSEVPKAENVSHATEKSTSIRISAVTTITVPKVTMTTRSAQEMATVEETSEMADVVTDSQEVTSSAEIIEFITDFVDVQTETAQSLGVIGTSETLNMPESTTMKEMLKMTELSKIPETSEVQKLTATPEISMSPNFTVIKETSAKQETMTTPETSSVTKQTISSGRLKPTVTPETSNQQKHATSSETSLVTKLTTTLERLNVSEHSGIPETATVPELSMPEETSEMFETVEWVNTVLPETWKPSETNTLSVVTMQPEMSATPGMTDIAETSMTDITSVKRRNYTVETTKPTLVTIAMETSLASETATETPATNQEISTGNLSETTVNRIIIPTFGASASTNIAATAASSVTATATTATAATGSSNTNSNSSIKTTTIASTTTTTITTTTATTTETTTTSVPAPVTTMTTVLTSGSPAVIVHITDKRRAVAGFNVTLTCEVKGIPQPTLSWFKVLPSGERMMLPGNDGRISLPAYNVLNIRDTRKTDSGIYACVAGNQYGYTENVTEITVIASTVIIQSPQDVTAVRGLESVMFNCVVAHDPSVSVTISWYHDQTFINTTTAPDYVVYENGSLLVMDVKREHAGIYSCHATSEIGDEEAMAMLTVQEEPEKPTLVSVLPNKNDLFAVDLTWTPGNNHNSVITAYIIEERIIERGVVYEEEEGWLKVANVSGMTTTYTLTGLNTYTYYEFRVKAQNGVGLSKPSSENFGYLTPELEPGAAPLHVLASVQTMDSLYITWDQLPYPAHNGILLGYIVRYKETGADDSKFRYKNTTNSDATGIQISGLKPYQQYDVSVAAYNSQGRGPFSEAVTLMTKEGVPSGRVQQVEVSVVNSTAVRVSWLPLNPDTTYGVIRGYKVQFHRIDGTRYQMVLVPAQGESGNKLWVTISGLQPMAIYEITIAAYTAKGDGPISNPSKVVLPASASSTTSSTATKTTTVKTTVTTGVINTTTGSSVHLETTSVSNPTKVPDIISSSEAQPIATATTTRVTITESTPSPVVTENMDTGPVWISEEDEVSTLTPGKPTTKYPTFPPKFIYCPEDQLVTVSSGFAPTVWWREPVVQDYYANPVRLSSNYKPGSKFEVGSTQIVYIAIDRRGVNATCFFKVNVEAQDFTCTGVPQLVNGYIKCDRVNYIYTCHAQCNIGYQVAAQYNGSHQCLTTGWTPNYKVGFASLACIKSERIMNKNSIVLTFIGSCPSDMNSFKTNFLQQIESRLRQKSLCDNEDTNFIEQYTCNRFNYQLSCKNAQALRQKRAADQLTLEMPVFIPSQNMTPEASKLIEERKQELEQVFLTDHSLIVDNMSFRFSKIAVMQDGLTCPTGWVNKGYKCEQCPAGTYLDLLSGQCQLCAAGSYQDQEAQLSCKQCPAGKTSAVGFFTEKQCYMPMASTDAPEPGSNSVVPGIDQTTVIIIVIAVIGGVLLLTAMIVAGVAVRNTCQRRRTLNLEKQKKQQIMNGKEYPQQYTNIAYAGVPPVKQAANGKRPSAKVVRASSSSSQISQSSTVIIPTRRNPMAYNAEVSVNLNSHSGQTLPTQIPGKSMNGNQPAVLTSRGTEVRAYSRGTGQLSSSARLSPDGTVLRQASPSTPSSDGPHQPVQVIPAQPIMPGNLPPGQYRKLPSGQIIRLVPINKPVKKNSHSKRYEMKRAVTKRPGPAGTVPHQGVFKKNVPVTAVSGYGTYPPRPARIVATAQGGRVVSSSSVRTKRDHGWNALTLLDKTST